jgi:hypothetical protein
MNKWYQMGIILRNKSKDRMDIKVLVEMLKHVNSCEHIDCKKIYIEETMGFIGNDNK